MKAIILPLLLFSLFVRGQEQPLLPLPRALFKVAPQNFTENTLKVGTEIFNKKKTKSYTVYLYGRFESNNSNQPFYYGEAFYKGLGCEFQYRKYISPLQNYITRKGKTYLQGIYFSGYLQGASYNNNGDFTYFSYDPTTGQQTNYIVNVEESIKNWGTGFTIGVHRTLWNVLYIDAYVGGGIQWSDITRSSNSNLNNYYYSSYTDITDPAYQGIMPKIGLQVGIAL
ncbi:MAG: hypothetical protein JNL53_06610 [Cyclobacteriaceae bacterium]|nr:hypothetical protein [Cyclobacteriaceae bacterium]